MEDELIFEGVVNHEEQYSIWPADRPLPLGWKAVGIRKGKPECLDYINSVWTDMRPLSLRRSTQESLNGCSIGQPASGGGELST